MRSGLHPHLPHHAKAYAERQSYGDFLHDRYLTPHTVLGEHLCCSYDFLTRHCGLTFGVQTQENYVVKPENPVDSVTALEILSLIPITVTE